MLENVSLLSWAWHFPASHRLSWWDGWWLELAFSILCVLRGLLGAIKHHDQNQPGEERAYFTLELSGHTPSLREIGAGTPDRRLQAGTGAETPEELCLLSCLNSAFLEHPETAALGWHCPQWSSTPHVDRYQENAQICYKQILWRCF